MYEHSSGYIPGDSVCVLISELISIPLFLFCTIIFFVRVNVVIDIIASLAKHTG